MWLGNTRSYVPIDTVGAAPTAAQCCGHDPEAGAGALIDITDSECVVPSTFYMNR